MRRHEDRRWALLRHGGTVLGRIRRTDVWTARAVKDAGANVLRGGAFKPRTSPYSFQGMELEGLRILRKAGKTFEIPIITEATTPEQVPVVAQYADMIQIGARNMQNYGLLRAAGKAQKPVLLKRGMMCTINEFLMSAEYILSEGNPNVVLCERGIRTFETETRNTWIYRRCRL